MREVLHERSSVLFSLGSALAPGVALVLGILTGVLFQGCSQPAPTVQGSGPFTARPPAHGIPETETPVSTVPRISLADEQYRHLASIQRDPLIFPLDDVSVVAPSLSPLRSGEEAIVISPGDKAFDLPCPTAVDASLFNQFRIRMRLTQGLACYLRWKGEFLGAAGLSAPVGTPILADGEWREYVIPLHGRDGTAWVGRIDRLQVILTQADDTVEIAEMGLFYELPSTPQQLSIAGQSHDVLYGTQAPWTLTVPENAVFSTYLGCPPVYEIAGAGRVRFRVTLERPDADPVTLFETGPSVFQTWRIEQADLGAFAGQRVTLKLEVDNLMYTKQDFAAWGAPLVLSRTRAPDAIPVVLISCDTLRADHVGCYGYERDTTPNLDRLAQEGVLFENAFVDEPWTLTSHMTMFTGSHRHHHKVNHSTNLPAEYITLPEALRSAGYLTAGFAGSYGWLAPWRGFGQGFDVFVTPIAGEYTFQPVLTTLAKVDDWLDGHPVDRFFLFFHTYEIHSKFKECGYATPYMPSEEGFVQFGFRENPPSYTREDREAGVGTTFLIEANEQALEIAPEEREHMIDSYDDCIRLVDHALGKLFADLRERALYDPALIIVTSDHGEAFSEHGRYLHDALYDPCVHVPLLIKFPHGAHGGKRVTELATNADLYPTVLDVLGLSTEQEMDGVSLVPLAQGKTGAGRDEVFLFYEYRRLEGLRTHDRKFIHDMRSGAHELYDLPNDPGELDNRFETWPPGERDELVESVETFYRQDEGWHFVSHGCSETLPLTLQIFSDEPIRSYRLSSSESWEGALDTATISRDGCSLEVILTTEPTDIDEVHVNAGRLVVTAKVREGEIPFAIATNAFARLASGDESWDLDPEDERLHTAPGLPHDDGPPTLRMWFDEPESPQGTTQALTEEDRATLESMGYVVP